MLNEGKQAENTYYQINCDEEEREQLAFERAEKEKFIKGLKRYPEKGIPVFIDDKEPEEEDWEKLTVVREDNRFYMGDFIPDPDTGRLREIRFDMVYHGELASEGDFGRRRRRKKKA